MLALVGVDACGRVGRVRPHSLCRRPGIAIPTGGGYDGAAPGAPANGGARPEPVTQWTIPVAETLGSAQSKALEPRQVLTEATVREWTM